MPCTWKGYGEPIPLLLINTGEKKKTREDFFGEKREASYRNKKKKRKRKQTWGGKNRDYGLCTGKKKNRPHPLGTTAVFSSPPLPVAPRATASRTKERESGRLALAREEREKEQNIRGKKTNNREKNSNLSLRPLSLRRREPLAATPFFFLAVTSCTTRDHRREGRILLTEWTKNRGRRSSKREIKKNHRLPPQPSTGTTTPLRPAPQATSAVRSVSFSCFFSGRSPLAQNEWAESGLVKKNQKYFKKICDFPAYFFY